jgi:hypothetical protein
MALAPGLALPLSPRVVPVGGDRDVENTRGETGAEDVEWSGNMLKSIEACLQASPTQKLLPPGRVLWFLHPSATAGEDGGGGDVDASRAGSGITGNGAARGAANTPPGADGERKSRRPLHFKGPREVFSKLVFTRRMLTDHMPVSYMWALDALLAQIPVSSPAPSPDTRSPASRL